MLPIMMQTMHSGKFLKEGRTVTSTLTPPSSPQPPTSRPLATTSQSSPTTSSPPTTTTHNTSTISTTELNKNCDELEEGLKNHQEDQGVESKFVNVQESQNINESVSENKHEFKVASDFSSNADASVMPFNHELIRQTHSRMANKFSELELQTGICLRSSLDNDCKQLQTSDVTDDAPNHQSVIITNNNKNISHNSATICNSNSINKNNNKIKPMIESNSRNPTAEVFDDQKQINILKEDLRMKNEIVEKLSYIRSEVENELQDLTASLFEEANKMVQDANVLRHKVEKDLKDTKMQMDILSAENVALKNLVIHSTPSTPKKNASFIHSQKKRASSKPRKGLPNKSPSNYELGADENMQNNGSIKTQNSSEQNNNDLSDLNGEIDPVYYQEFKEWRKSPTLDPSKSQFMKRIYDEEIYTVFNFRNKDLTSAILRSIERNTLTVEQIKNDTKNIFPKKCKLLEDFRPCIYRMRVDEGQWYSICSLSRERITTVCDLLCYLRYIKDGLVKSEPKEIYWQIMRKRHSIVKAKLGLLYSYGDHKQ